MQYLNDYSLPLLADSSPVPEIELRQWSNAGFLLTAMEKLNLGIYKHPRDDFWWIGSVAPELHDHERWIARVSANVVKSRAGRGNWSDCSVDMIDTCQRSYMGELLDELEGLRLWMEDMRVSNHLGTSLSADRTTVLHAIFEDFGYLNFEQLMAFKAQTLTWKPELHDLFYHFDVYLEMHPEVGDIPRDILLRMHGFGYYVDYREENFDLLGTVHS